jgi:hypothetical protein
LPYELQYRAVTVASDYAAALATFQTLGGLRGKRDVLIREDENGNEHWCYARLMRVPMQRQAVMEGVSWMGVQLPFMIESQWYGASHGVTLIDDGGVLDDDGYLDDVEYFELSHGVITEINAVNNGNSDTCEMCLTVTNNVSGTLTSLEVMSGSGVGNTGTCVYWIGEVAVGEMLIIDGGTRSVTIYNVLAEQYRDVYSGFVVDTPHSLSDWFKLCPGTTTFYLRAWFAESAGTAQASLRYYDTWE